VALDIAELEDTEDGFKIIIRRSKTDQEGHGETVAIASGVPTCPVRAAADSSISEGRCGTAAFLRAWRAHQFGETGAVQFNGFSRAAASASLTMSTR
jgi:hypothetical protein